MSAVKKASTIIIPCCLAFASWSVAQPQEAGVNTPAAASMPISNPAGPAGNTVNAHTLSAAGSAGNTANSRATDAAPLPAPLGLEAESGGDRVLLAWEPVRVTPTAKITYQVFRSECPIQAFPPGSPWPDPINLQPISEEYFLDSGSTSRIPPQPNMHYFYAVIAIDAQGNSSAISQVLEIDNTTKLSPPLGVETKAGDASIQLKWLPVFSGGEHGLDGYEIHRSTQSGVIGTSINPKPLEKTFYLDGAIPGQGLKNGVEYFYTIFALDKLCNRSQPSEQVRAMPFKPASAPAGLTATGKSDDMIEIKWSASSAGTFPVKGYNIYRGTDPEKIEGPLNKTLVRKTRYVDCKTNSLSQPILGQIYYYRIIAMDERELEGEPPVTIQATPRAPMAIPKTGLLSTAIPGLPPESSLTISGRKKIDIGYTEVIPLNTGKDGSTTRSPSLTSGLSKGFNLEQELQVKLEGKVGKKITVDVDYDDTTEEQQKISIVYAGDPDDVIQEAAFGDILLDLPRTEFAGYNKSLFGAKFKIGLDRFRFTAIGAQTKGESAVDIFKGNTSKQIRDIQDINFMTFTYYYLTKSWPGQVNHPDLPVYDSSQKNHGIVSGSVKLYVANTLDTGNITADTVRVTRLDGSELNFNYKSPGIDYTVDYSQGILTFLSRPNKTSVIAVAYKYWGANDVVHTVGYKADGTFDFTPGNLIVPSDGITSDTAHLIQDYNSTNNYRDYRMMLMNRYSLGTQNILDPLSDDEFDIKIFTAGGAPRDIILPKNQNDNNREYIIDPNFGTIHFKYNYPFKKGEYYYTGDYDFNPENSDAYNPQLNAGLGGTGSSAANNYKIHIEFKNLITNFQLSHWNVINNSEVIKKDGRKLRRNTDYYIDYDTGFITFLNPASISSSTEITINYEYLPFGSKFQTNLLGARAEYDLIEKKLSLGTTYIYNSSQEPQEIPDTRSTPTSLSLIDGDIKLSLNPDDFGEILEPLTGKIKIPLSIEVAAEAAHSNYAVNTFRKAGEDGIAMIDGMEGSDNLRALPMDNNSWFPASVPWQFSDPDSRRYIDQSRPYELGRVPADSDDKKFQLRWDYANLSSDTWDGFVYPISTSGANLHDYRFLEISVFSSAAASRPIVLHFELGVVSEDSNGNGNLNFEGDAKNKTVGYDVGLANKFSTEIDTNTGQYKIIPDDTCPRGIYPEGAPAGYWGEENNLLNNEDLDRNDQLDRTESYYEYEYTISPGWNYIKIPLSQFARTSGDTPPTSNIQSQQFLSFVKQVRMWIAGESSLPGSGYVQFETVQLTGNKWQAKVAPGTRNLAGEPINEPDPEKFNATTISQKTEPSSYTPNTNFYIYDQNNEEEILNEQALKLEYNLNRGDVVDPLSTTITPEPAYYLTRDMTTGTGYDYSGYDELRMDVYKPAPTGFGEILFIRFGLDQENYYQYSFPLDDIPVGQWHTLTVKLDGSDHKRSAHFCSGVIPGISQIKQISLGVINPNFFSNPEVLWLNNLRVTGARPKHGNAIRLTTNTRLSDIFLVTTDFRDLDSDFITIDGTSSGKQHSTNSRVSGNLTKLSFLPVSADWNRTETFTEPEHLDDPAYSNNYSLPNVINETVSGDINYKQIAGLDLRLMASKSRKKTDYIEQIYNANNLVRTYILDPSISYTLPGKIFNLPIGSSTLTGKLTYTDTHTVYDSEGASKLGRSELWDRWKHTREENYSYQGRYQPVRFLSLNPSYTYSQTSGRGHLSLYRFYAELDPARNPDNIRCFSDSFRVSRINRVVGLGLNLQNLPVISPSLTYSMTNTRDYINDTLSIPGSLSLRSGLALGDIWGNKSFPKINLSQNYTLSATYKELKEEYPISGLDFKSQWIIAPLEFKQENSLFDQAYINSKSLSENISTSFNLLKDISLSPQGTTAWTRRMNSPGNFSTTQTLSLGSSLTWNRIPFLQPWVTLQSLNLDYRYSENKTFDTANIETTRNTTHKSSLTLPFRLTNDFSGTFTLGATNGIRSSGSGLETKIFENAYTGGLSLSYNLHMTEPIKLPNFWPFMGALIKIEQALRITNAFNLSLEETSEINTFGNEKSSNMFTNDTTFNYSLWRNVEGDLKITNQWFFDKTKLAVDKDYWAISLKAGMTASF